MAITSLRTTNSILSKLINKVSCKDHKKMFCSNIHMLFMNLPYHYHKINIFSDVIVLNLSTVEIVDGGLYFIFPFHFILSFLFSFLFLFLFLEQLRLGFISHAVTSVTNLWRSHKTDHETWEKEVEDTRTK